MIAVQAAEVGVTASQLRGGWWLAPSMHHPGPREATSVSPAGAGHQRISRLLRLN